MSLGANETCREASVARSLIRAHPSSRSTSGAAPCPDDHQELRVGLWRTPVRTSLKFRPPSGPANLIPRPRIDHLLDQAVTHPLTVMSAGAGSGKTSAAASWAQSRHTVRHVAWLGLDRTDDSPHAFWSGLLGALLAGGHVPTDSRLREFTPASVVGAHEVASLLARLADLPRPVV